MPHPRQLSKPETNGATPHDPVSSEQRWRREKPCPICEGHPDLPQGQSERCWGFESRSGKVAYCTREELAGDLEPDGEAGFPHQLTGPCGCGEQHGWPEGAESEPAGRDLPPMVAEANLIASLRERGDLDWFRGQGVQLRFFGHLLTFMDEYVRESGEMPSVMVLQEHEDTFRPTIAVPAKGWALREWREADKNARASAAMEAVLKAHQGKPTELLRALVAEAESLDLSKDASPKTLALHSGADILAMEEARRDWLVKPFIARHTLTVIFADAKAGKSTWLGCALKAMSHGLPFMDAPTRPARTVYLTEEPLPYLQEQIETLGLGETEDIQWAYLAETVERGLDRWDEIIAAAETALTETDAEHLVIDTVSQWGEVEDEWDAAQWKRALTPLHRIAGRGVAVTLVHHSRKSGGSIRDAARGSGHLLAAGGILIYLQLLKEGDESDPRRKVTAVGKAAGLPTPTTVVEWDGASHIEVLGSAAEANGAERMQRMLRLLPPVDGEPIEVEAVREAFEEAHGSPPGAKTVKKALDSMVDGGTVERLGKGVKGDPYVYRRAE